jgi:hypothetical protein
MITPQGELHGSIMAWVIRLLFTFVLAKEKPGPVLKKMAKRDCKELAGGRVEKQPR